MSSRRLIPAGSGQEVGREDGFFPCISGIFRLFFLFGAWYNKVEIPQTLYQQQHEST